MKRLATVTNSELLQEGETSPEIIQFHAPSLTIPCSIEGTAVLALYNPMVGVNIISSSFASDHLGERRVTPTTKFLRTGPRSIIKGIGIMHDVLVWHMKMEIALDFHVFEVQDFDILIGHPVEKLFLDVSTLGKLEVSLGGRSYTLPIGQSTNSSAKPAPQEEPFKEVLAVMPIDTSKPSLEQDAELFIQEEDDFEETLELPIHEQPTRPLIELKPHPTSPHFDDPDHNQDTTMIFHDEPLETENPWARESAEALSLECEENGSIDEHGSFILESPKPCSFSTSPESATCCTMNAFTSCNLLKAPSRKTFRRMVVDSFVYHKHCKFRGCAIALTLQLKQNRRMVVKAGVTSPIDSCRKKL